MRLPVICRYLCLVLATSLLIPQATWAGGFFRNGAVGGVSIDARGVLSEPSTEEAQSLRQTRRPTGLVLMTAAAGRARCSHQQ